MTSERDSGVFKGAMVHTAAAGPQAPPHRPDTILGIPKSPSFHSGLDLMSSEYQGLPVQLPSLLGKTMGMVAVGENLAYTAFLLLCKYCSYSR